MLLPQYSQSLFIGSAIIFALAIVHTFLTPKLFFISQQFKNKQLIYPEASKKYYMISEILSTLSRVELVFFFWPIVLFCLFFFLEGPKLTFAYFEARNYSFPLYVIMMVILVNSKPIIFFADRVLTFIAGLGKSTPRAWWWTLLIGAPFMSCLVKETGAMIIAATMLSKKIYNLMPSRSFRYATMGLLFSNISIGGILTPMSSRSLFLVQPTLKWKPSFIFENFSWKALIAIIISTTTYFLIFRKEFQKFPEQTASRLEKKTVLPFWLVLVHIVFIVVVIYVKSQTVTLAALFVVFLIFHKVTLFYQNPLHLQKTAFIGLFYVGVLILGDLQEWWISLIMNRLSNIGTVVLSFVLSSFLDNTFVSYLAVNVKKSGDCYHYLVFTGITSAGGLTLLSNSPNLLGYIQLREFFNRMSFIKLFLYALPPSLTAILIYWILKGVPGFSSCRF